MCGRYTLSDPGALQLRFGLVEFAEVRLPAPRYNIAPAQIPAKANGPPPRSRR